jgi:hypothetical protein
MLCLKRRRNMTLSKVRAHVEHVFGHQDGSIGGKIVGTIGIARATSKIGMMNPGYNMRRWFGSNGQRQRLLEWVRGRSLPCVAQIGLAVACKSKKGSKIGITQHDCKRQHAAETRDYYGSGRLFGKTRAARVGRTADQ